MSAHIRNNVESILKKYCVGFLGSSVRVNPRDRLVKVSVVVRQDWGRIHLTSEKNLRGLAHDIRVLSDASGIPMQVVERTVSCGKIFR